MTETVKKRALAREAEKEEKAKARAITKMAMKTKETVYELEEENDRYIYVFRSKGGWWKMGGRSALFYANIVSERLSKKPPKVLKDTDHFSTFRIGVVSKRDLKVLAAELSKLKMKMKKIDPTIYRFEFDKPIEVEVIGNLIQAKELQNERANKLVDTQILLPKMHIAIRELMKMIWYFGNKHRENLAKKVLLPKLLDRAMDLKRIYSRTSNGYFEVKDGLFQIMMISNDMMADIAFLKEIDEISMTNCNKMQNKLGEIIHTARTELNKIKRKEDGEADRSAD